MRANERTDERVAQYLHPSSPGPQRGRVVPLSHLDLDDQLPKGPVDVEKLQGDAAFVVVVVVILLTA